MKHDEMDYPSYAYTYTTLLLHNTFLCTPLHTNDDLTKLFFKWANPGLFLFIIVLFSLQFQ